MKCGLCNSTNTYVKKYNHVYTIKGKKVAFVSERRFCANCDNLVYDAELDNKASEMAISLYNKEYGITKDEIINLRNKYNLSQELFSKIIGCAKKTLISYEKGKSIPNDSYLIVLKSLNSKPETILTLIEANKEQFTKKEYDRINNKLATLIPDNIKGLFYDANNKLNEYNGYNEVLKDKVYNMILFFAENNILKTKLLKEMFYADFLCYKNTCKSITGLVYSKLPYGPVPDQYEHILSEGSKDKVINLEIKYNGDYEYHNIISNKKFDKSFFNKEELDAMKKVKEKFKNFGSKDIVDFSHNEDAFIKTAPLNKISYDFAFDINID